MGVRKLPADPGGLPTAQHGALVPTECLETCGQPHAPPLQPPPPSRPHLCGSPPWDMGAAPKAG